MVKKHRTKAQKQRAAERRQFQFSKDLKLLKPAEPAGPKSALVTTPSVEKTTTVINKRSLTHRDLRISLVVLGSLLAAQIVLWLVFRASLLDEQLYNWIQI